MQLYFATQNPHKRDEMAQLLVPHTIIIPKEAHIDFFCEETGSTFIENALLKAISLYHTTGKASFADDSGLVVDALGGAPGIFSARYGAIDGKELSSSEKNALLLSQLAGIDHPYRSARFVCSIALVLSEYRQYVFQEIVEGSIATTPYGDGGFGYDPVFLVENSGRTMAELTQREKNMLSHRGKAVRVLLQLLQSLEQEETFYVC